MVAAIAVCSQKSTILQNPVCLRDPNSSFLGGSLKGLCLQLKPRNKRRDSISLVVASASPTATPTNNGSGRFYFNITGFPFPLGPFLNRRTIRTEVSFFTFNVTINFNVHLGSFINFFFFSLELPLVCFQWRIS
jgi:hypothetical protein